MDIQFIFVRVFLSNKLLCQGISVSKFKTNTFIIACSFRLANWEFPMTPVVYLRILIYFHQK